MPSDPSLPYRGDNLDGYRAPVSTGITPRALRHIRYTPTQNFGIICFLFLSPLSVGAVYLGSWMLAGESVWSVVLGAASLLVGRPRVTIGAFFGLLSIAGGFILGLLGLVMLLAAFYVHRKPQRTFRDGLLIPGIVTSKDPLVLLALADMKKSEHGQEYAIARLDPKHLPVHPHEPGTRVPCIASFSEELGDRWLWFTPHPVSWGKGDAFDIERCFERLGPEPFRKLEGCIARGPVPTFECEIVMLDRDMNFVEVRNIAELAGIRKAHGREAERPCRPTPRRDQRRPIPVAPTCERPRRNHEAIQAGSRTRMARVYATRRPRRSAFRWDVLPGWAACAARSQPDRRARASRAWWSAAWTPRLRDAGRVAAPASRATPRWIRTAPPPAGWPST